MEHNQLIELLEQLLALPSETEWLEFKQANNSFSFEKIGKYFSALSNEANLKRQNFGWLIFGVNDNHQVVGTNYRPNRADLDNLKRDISNQTNGGITLHDILEVEYQGERVIFF